MDRKPPPVASDGWGSKSVGGYCAQADPAVTHIVSALTASPSDAGSFGALIVKLESAYEGVQAHRASSVALPQYEIVLLSQVEVCRDVMTEALAHWDRGDRAQLQDQPSAHDGRMLPAGALWDSGRLRSRCPAASGLGLRATLQGSPPGSATSRCSCRLRAHRRWGVGALRDLGLGEVFRIALRNRLVRDEANTDVIADAQACLSSPRAQPTVFNLSGEDSDGCSVGAESVDQKALENKARRAAEEFIDSLPRKTKVRTSRRSSARVDQRPQQTIAACAALGAVGAVGAAGGLLLAAPATATVGTAYAAGVLAATTGAVGGAVASMKPGTVGDVARKTGALVTTGAESTVKTANHTTESIVRAAKQAGDVTTAVLSGSTVVGAKTSLANVVAKTAIAANATREKTEAFSRIASEQVSQKLAIAARTKTTLMGSPAESHAKSVVKPQPTVDVPVVALHVSGGGDGTPARSGAPLTKVSETAGRGHGGDTVPSSPAGVNTFLW
eukprot:TRINITY_DN18176_c0_g1_i3.p1 TRINITY_DN18176_c0_g1~~TRINITY_DN18176_c0_g1_i3.p1  ORF type:complete len:501 (+),score=71.38 TRINITY_DN18176_c0_g1_i3:128-1630(+)